jgi:ribonuclease P protein component
MLKRQNRLDKNVKFVNPPALTCPLLVLKKKENGLELNRFGVIISKRIDKRAVVRNSLKRIFRDAFANLEKKINIKHDILIITKKEVLSKKKEEIGLVLKNAFEKAGIIKK